MCFPSFLILAIVEAELVAHARTEAQRQSCFADPGQCGRVNELRWPQTTCLHMCTCCITQWPPHPLFPEWRAADGHSAVEPYVTRRLTPACLFMWGELCVNSVEMERAHIVQSPWPESFSVVWGQLLHLSWEYGPIDSHSPAEEFTLKAAYAACAFSGL